MYYLILINTSEPVQNNLSDAKLAITRKAEEVELRLLGPLPVYRDVLWAPCLWVGGNGSEIPEGFEDILVFYTSFLEQNSISQTISTIVKDICSC